MVKNRIRYVLLVVFLGAMFVATNHRLILYMLIAILAVTMSSFLLLMLERRICSIKLSFPRSGQLNKTQNLSFIIDRSWNIPFGRLSFRLEYENSLYEETHTLQVNFDPACNKVSEYQLPLGDSECGVFEIECKDGKIEDLLGIFRLPVSLPAKLKFRAYPIIPTMNVRNANSIKKKYEGEEYDLHKRGLDVTEVHDLREYHVGDSLNSIHWKLSSKIDRLVVREFGNPLNQQAMILYDAAFPGYQDNHTLVNGVLGMTAAISRALLRGDRSHRIGFLYNHEWEMKNVSIEQDMLDTLDELLGSHLSHMGLSTVDIENTIFSEHVIMVTGKLDEEFGRQIGDRTELTVVLLTDSGREYAEEHGNFRLLAIPIDEMDERIHQIEI